MQGIAVTCGMLANLVRFEDSPAPYRHFPTRPSSFRLHPSFIIISRLLIFHTPNR